MNRFTKVIFLLAFVLLAYGYMCRSFGIYFFWDSRFLGWLLIFIGFTSYLFGLNKLRRNQGKKTLWVKIGIGVLLLGFLITGYVIFEFKNDEAYQTAIEYLKTNSQLKDEIGNIKGFGLFPSGSVSTVSYNGSESGDATFTITVRGDKKYKDVVVNLKKTPDLFWTVSSLEQ